MNRSFVRILLGATFTLLFSLNAPALAELRLTLTVTGNGSAPMTEVLSTTSGGTIFASDFGVYNPTPPVGMPFTLPFDGFDISNLTARSILSTRTITFSPFSVTNNGSGGTLSITVSDNGETTPGPYGLNLSSNATVTGNTGTVTFQSFAGNSINDTATFPSQKLIFNASGIDPASSGSGAGSQNAPVASGFHPTGSTFSITNVSTFQLSQGQSVSTTAGNSIVSTPEPGTLAMVMAGLPVVGIVAWRKRRSASV